MRLAILADIHANLEALEAVLIAVDREGVDRIISLGDVVGYGADPLGCIYRLKEVDALCILGNHDQAVIDPVHIRAFNLWAKDSLLGARQSLTSEAIEFLGSAAFRRVEYGGVFAHANPIKPEDWDPLFMYDQVVWCMEHLDWQVGFFGHTHYPAIYCQMESRVLPLTSSKVAIGPHRYLINPGSVGQPRDGDWRAAFAIWDVDNHFVELHRVEYTLEQAQEKIYQTGSPYYQAERLARGE